MLCNLSHHCVLPALRGQCVPDIQKLGRTSSFAETLLSYSLNSHDEVSIEQTKINAKISNRIPTNHIIS